METGGFRDFRKRAVEGKVGEENWIWKALNAKQRGLDWVLWILVTGSQGQGVTGLFEQHVGFL